MALSASNATESRSFSVGPLKIQLLTFSVASGDTSGTVTCDALSSVDYAIVSGLDHTSAPTYSGNVITLAFVDDVATRHGQVIAFGR